MKKYTPGPWQAVDDYGTWEIESNDYPIATVNHNRPQHEANARLIAAAPDLLAALRGLLTPCRCDPAPGTACAHVLAAEAAIARATGEV